MKTLENNKLAELFNLDVIKDEIKNCPKDEIIILLPHYSINKPEYSDEEYTNCFDSEDFDDLGDYLGCMLTVTDYDDLVADPHSLLSE